jgi:hypothetical protein
LIKGRILHQKTKTRKCCKKHHGTEKPGFVPQRCSKGGVDASPFERA